MLGMFTGQSGLLEVKCRTLQIAKKQEKKEKKEKKRFMFLKEGSPAKTKKKPQTKWLMSTHSKAYLQTLVLEWSATRALL